MALQTRGKRLLRRYPILKDVPEDDRPSVVRSALRHPLLLLPFAVVAIAVLPLYFNEMFQLLQVEQEENMLMRLTKYAGIMLVPIAIAVPLLSRFVVPNFIRREMVKRGYLPASDQ